MERSDFIKLIFLACSISLLIIISTISLTGVIFYVVNVIVFSFIGFVAYYFIRKENIFFIDKKIILIVFFAAVVQIFVNVIIAIFVGFGRSPYLSSNLSIIYNIVYFSSNLFCIEFLRVFLLNNLSIKRKLSKIIIVTLIISFVSLPFLKLEFLNTPFKITEFLGSEFLPGVSQSVISTFFAFLGGPLTSFSYRWVLSAFELLSPILPDFPWTLKSAIGVASPFLGLYILTESLDQFFLVRKGLMSRNELRIHKKSSSDDIKWFMVIITSVLLIWGSVGLLGFNPTVVATGSMKPALDVGDVVITVKTAPKEIKINDIIRYYREGESVPIIHRVVDLYYRDDELFFVTKGDANNAEDAPSPTSSREIFKTVLIIPKIGLVSIFIKGMIYDPYSVMHNNPLTSVAVASGAIIFVIFTYHLYRNQPNVRLRRRLGR